MLTTLQIGNFKAFAEAQRIPIRPLTLIYGANSSGKSSIIHSLVLARHAMETGDLDIHRTNIGGEAVDLGGFRQYIHRREVNRRMEWSVEIDTAGFKGRLAELFAPVSSARVSIEIGIPQIEETKEQESVDPRTGKKIIIKVPTGSLVTVGDPEVLSYSITTDNAQLLSMSKRRDGNLQLDRLDHEQPLFREVLKAIVETSTTAESIHPSDYEGLDEAIADIVPSFAAMVGKFLPEGLARSEADSEGGQASLFPISRGRRREDLAAAVRFFIPRILDELVKGIGQAVASELSRLQYLGPLRSYPPRHLSFAQHHDPNWIAGGGYAWDVVRRDAEVRKLVNTWLTAPERLQTPYELILRDLVGIDQLEGPLLDGLERLNEEGLDIEYEEESRYTSGGAWPVIKDPEAEVEKLRNLIRGSEIERLNELILIDRRSNTVVSHRDVGIGVSQVLPVLVSAYVNQNQIVAIEQPEIHLHPALQADLGDLFLQSALGNNQNRFLIETHSEHLLLRIMRRMRQTTAGELPDGIPKIRPEDVMVLFVEPDGPRSIIREMPLNEHGDLVKAWPGGFFEEGLREVF
ncbi:MAG: AAA family ATPase [Thermodesulfobacteriota bacterium]|nr:AAA family ATPase [Thermodesulfobacteriota bacterium]